MSGKKEKLADPIKRAKLTLRNALGYLQGNWRRLGVATHLWEQAIWRRTKAPECMEKGECIYCGCEMIGKTLEDRGCENPERYCYPDMMNKKDWEKYKKDKDIKLFLC